MVATGFAVQRTIAPSVSQSGSQYSSGTSSTSNISSSSSTSEITSTVLAHLQSIESRNWTDVMRYYAKNASLTWKGDAPFGWGGGTYKPWQNISLFYRGFHYGFDDTDLTFTNSNNRTAPISVSVTNSSENHALATYYFYIFADFPPNVSRCGYQTTFNGTIRAEALLIRQGGGANPPWLISAETWDFVHPFNSGVCIR